MFEGHGEDRGRHVVRGGLLSEGALVIKAESGASVLDRVRDPGVASLEERGLPYACMSNFVLV